MWKYKLKIWLCSKKFCINSSKIFELQKSFKYKFSSTFNFMKNETNTTLISLQKEGADIPPSYRPEYVAAERRKTGTTYCIVDYQSLIIIISWIKDGYLWNLSQGNIFCCQIYLNFLYWYQWKINNQTKTNTEMKMLAYFKAILWLLF